MGDEPLSRGRGAVVAAVGFLVVALASGSVVLATDRTEGSAAASATPGPSGIDVRLRSATGDESSPAMFRLLAENRGEPVLITSFRQVSPGYEPEAGFPDLALRSQDVADLTVSLVPTCGAGIGVDPLPELELDVIGAASGATTIRLPLTRDLGLPDLLLAPCPAPLSSGARVEVAVREPQNGGDLRLQVDVTAGAGVLWLSSFYGEAVTFLTGGPSFPLVLSPGVSRRLDVELQPAGLDCTTLGGARDPLRMVLVLRTGADSEQQQREVSLAEVGGSTYRRAVTAAVARVCP